MNFRSNLLQGWWIEGKCKGSEGRKVVTQKPSSGKVPEQTPGPLQVLGEIGPLLAWGRYLYWADLSWRKYNQYMKEQEKGPENYPLWIASVGEFLARLWIVIEGWQDLQLKDPYVDRVLQARPDLVKVLKRFRHGMYHFQENIVDERFLELLNKTEYVYWTDVLHEAFCGYLWNRLNPTIGTIEQRRDIRDSLAAIVGWLPTDLPQAKAILMREQIEEVRNSQTADSQAAKDLLQALTHAVKVSEEAVAGLRFLHNGWIQAIEEGTLPVADPDSCP